MQNLNPAAASAALLHELLDEAVKQGLFMQQARPFLDWFHEHLKRVGPKLWPGAGDPLLRGMAFKLGRELWNRLPLPRNRFRPEPLPKPERNDPCPCGSGAKHKHCCALTPPLPIPDGEFVWQLAIRHLPRAQLQDAIQQQQIPVPTLGALADERLEQDDPKGALAILEPLFEADLAALDQRHGVLVNLLCNAYDALRAAPAKKIRLLQRLTGAPAKSVRANAWQRLATVRMDQGRDEEAWRCFQEAQRADANDPDLSHLELLLLMARGEQERVKERAQFWLLRLQRQGVENPELLEVLRAAARDPATAFAEFGRDRRDPHLLELETLLKIAQARTVPAYRAQAIPVLNADDPEAVADHYRRVFRGMGIAEGELDKHIAKIQSDLKNLRAPPGDETTPETESMERVLAPPAALARLEERWRAVYPFAKPMSTQPLPRSQDDPWEEPQAGRWLAFLKDNPGAFDSLDILDDLLMAVDLHGEDELPGVYEQMAAPLLNRGLMILDTAVAGQESVQLPWRVAENRPALRLLSRRINLHLDRREAEAAARLMERLVALNPNDNHGYRCLLMEHYLRAGDNARALSLWDRYADDWYNPEMSYGYALALYRVDRREEAAQTLRKAVKQLPEVRRALLASKVKPPKLSEFGGIAVGGKDQAAFYRDDMLDIWQATPGALDWLRRGV